MELVEATKEEEINQQESKVFLGGTIRSNWRKTIIPELKIKYFDPVVAEQSSKTIQKEREEKESSNIHLCLITPEQKEFFTFADLFDSLIENKRVVFAFYENKKRFNPIVKNTLIRIGKLVHKHGGIWVTGEKDFSVNNFSKILKEVHKKP